MTACHDCGLAYGAPGWCDVVLPNDVGSRISPTWDPPSISGCGLGELRWLGSSIMAAKKKAKGPKPDYPGKPGPKPGSSQAREALKKARAASVAKTRGNTIQRIDWTTIKAEYVTQGATTLNSLSRKHGVNYTSLCRRADAENWKEERRIYVDALIEEARQKAIVLVASAAAEHYKEILGEIRDLRGRAMRVYRKQLEAVDGDGEGGTPSDMLEVSDDVAEKITKRKGEVTKRRVRRKRVRVDTQFIRRIMQMEVDLVTGLIGVNKSGGSGGRGAADDDDAALVIE